MLPLTFSVEVKDEWSCTFAPPYTFLAGRDTTLPLYFLSKKMTA
jgi:hypothetical protein